MSKYFKVIVILVFTCSFLFCCELKKKQNNRSIVVNVAQANGTQENADRAKEISTEGDNTIYEWIVYQYDKNGNAYQSFVFRGKSNLSDYLVKFHNGFCYDCETYVLNGNVIMFEVPVPKDSKLGYSYKVAGDYGKTQRSIDSAATNPIDVYKKEAPKEKEDSNKFEE